MFKPKIFESNKNLIVGVSTKNSFEVNSKFGFNLSLKVGDNPEIVKSNRNKFANELGINFNQVANADQIHSDFVKIISNNTAVGECDALITEKENLFLSVTVADCVPILIFDEEKNISAAVHAGWRGTSQNIVSKTIQSLIENFKSNPKNLKIFIGPSAGDCCYKVDSETSNKFENSVVEFKDSSYYVNLKMSNYFEMQKFGINKNNIEVSNICTICNLNFHSFRRDKNLSGRMMAIIGVKK